MKATDKQKKEVISKLCLMDDILMKNVFNDPECTQLLLRIIMKQDDLVIESVQTEYEIKNIFGRSVRLDIFAKDTDGSLYDIEIQRDSAGYSPERARLNSGLIDSYTTDPGEDPRKMPDNYVIFITEHDVEGSGWPIYYIFHTVYGKNSQHKTRSYIILVNQEIKDDTPLGKLMADFSQTDPSKFNYPILAKKVHELKETERGESKMSKELQEIIDIERKDAKEEGRTEGRIEGKVEGRIEGKVEGRIEGKVEGRIEGKVESIKNMMNKLGFSIEKAMETLDVPENEYEKYRKLVLNPAGIA